MKNTKQILSAVALVMACTLSPQAKEVFEITPEWQAKMKKIAPAKAMATPKKDRTMLVFSLITGYDHKVTPKTGAIVKMLGQKTGAWKVFESNDIEEFTSDNLKKYDAVVLNNNCPNNKDRDIFRDVLINMVDKYGAKYKALPLAEREVKAKALLDSFMKYVENGGGLVTLHGGIANFMYNDDFSAMLGGSFHFHPRQQQVVLNIVNPDHPLTKCFKGKPFIHVDEPYLFNRAYKKMNFHPLLEMDMSKIGKDKKVTALPPMKRYTAWIKRYGKGHVFYCSPSHNPSSFDQPELLQFMLGGIQYALGDLDCDDSPLKK
ncbi:MAG: ThuA domain-containing protein [Kiritimatiellae bacterium]|jgi:type 1 glutamine amidotransferase|nr:ThuA domain-containing protein [Kiritimatiellia bacterium]